MKATKLNLLLLVVVILLVAVALYEPGIKKTAAPARLLPVAAEEITEITILNGEQRAIVLRRDPQNGWQMIEPLQVAANRYKVDSVLAILEQQPSNRFEIDTARLARYGLQTPQVELRLSGPKGEHRLIFGSQTPLNHYRYLRLGNEVVTCTDALMPRAQGCARVVTIKDVAYYPVASLYTNFIASRLLPEGAKMASIELPDFRLVFSEGAWTLEMQDEATPTENRPSADQLTRWLDGWRYASSVDIEAITERKKDANQSDDGGIDAGQGEVVITLSTGDKLRWSISLTEDDGLILGRPDLGIEYHMSDSQREALLTPPQPQAPQQVPQQAQERVKS